MNRSIDNNDLYGWPLRFLQWFCPPHLYEEIEGDLIQRFNRDIRFGESESTDDHRLTKARLKLLWNVILFFRPGIILKNRQATNADERINLFIGNFSFKNTNDLIG